MAITDEEARWLAALDAGGRTPSTLTTASHASQAWWEYAEAQGWDPTAPPPGALAHYKRGLQLAGVTRSKQGNHLRGARQFLSWVQAGRPDLIPKGSLHKPPLPRYQEPEGEPVPPPADLDAADPPPMSPEASQEDDMPVTPTTIEAPPDPLPNRPKAGAAAVPKADLKSERATRRSVLNTPRVKPNKADTDAKRVIDKRLPPSVRIILSKRDDQGHLNQVGTYTARDIASEPDLPTWIQRYLVGRYGYGEYQVAQIDEKGGRTEKAPIIIPPPIGHTGQPGIGAPASSNQPPLTEVLDTFNKIGEQSRAAAEAAAAKQENLLQTALQMAASQNKGIDPTLLLLLQQQKPAAPADGGLGAIMPILLAKLAEPPPPPLAPLPPLPPPPPRDLTPLFTSLASVITAGISAATTLATSKQPAPDPVEKLLSALPVGQIITSLMERTPSEELRREIRELRERFENGPNRGVSELVNNVQAVKDLADQLGGGSGNFAEIAGTVAANLPAVAAALSEMRAKPETPPAPPQAQLSASTGGAEPPASPNTPPQTALDRLAVQFSNHNRPDPAILEDVINTLNELRNGPWEVTVTQLLNAVLHGEASVVEGLAFTVLYNGTGQKVAADDARVAAHVFARNIEVVQRQVAEQLGLDLEQLPSTEQATEPDLQAAADRLERKISDGEVVPIRPEPEPEAVEAEVVPEESAAESD